MARHAMALPEAQGALGSADACGLGFVAELNREPTHEVVGKGLEILERLAHRGAAGCDPCSGDACGVLRRIAHPLY
jgi:glutamate synthase (NADPH/NADH) large chain